MKNRPMSCFGISGITVLVGALFLVGCGEAGEPRMVSTSSDIEVVDDFPAAGSETFSVTFTNRGEGPAEVRDARVELLPKSTGTLGLVSGPSPGTEVDVDESVTLEVEFEPDSEHPGGCTFAVQGLAVLSWGGEGVFERDTEASIWFGGECDSDLRCLPVHLEIQDVKVGRSKTVQISCRNITDETKTFAGAVIDSDVEAAFDIGFHPAPGDDISPGGEILATVELTAADEGSVEALYNFSTEGGGDFPVRISANATGLWPMCSSSSPPTSAIPEEIDGYTFELESSSVRSYAGELADTSGTNESMAPMLGTAYLLADGAFLNEYCDVSTSGTSFRWDGVACQDGLGSLYNVMPIALSDEVEENIDLIELGDRVQFDGYDIDRIIREGWWSDGGQTGNARNRAMFITRICHP